ncbi:MAG TPA: glycoside hydrolase family 5 protein [Ktedonobacteraceae bacterium]|nr:glycoside hydrolase family 5 protein [Ktedonobacteraceae bacterium]
MRRPRIAGTQARRILPLLILGTLILTACAPTATTVLKKASHTPATKTSTPVTKKAPGPCRAGYQVGFLKTFHSELVDASSGCQVTLTGVNWFGFETSSFAPHGLGMRNWQDMLKQMVQAGFNTLRLPFTDQLFDPGSQPQGINYQLNPDLKGIQGLALMDKIIEGAHTVGLKVILDRHDPTADQRTALWYTNQVSQARWIQDWVMLAKHYQGNTTIIGADLDNEPHSPATWGSGNPTTDWRLAAEKAGNAILAVNPQWLIIVEGIDVYQGDSYWWGGNLEGATKYPVRLSEPGKLVYSAHDYGPSVYKQSWFRVSKPADLAYTLPPIWKKYWAYLQQDGTAPLLMGEFGGPSMGQDIEGMWQRTLVSFLKKNNISYTYWAWNADSGDTGGILNNDWTTINQSKVNVLSAYQWPLLDKPQFSSSNSSGSATAIQNAYQWPTSK